MSASLEKVEVEAKSLSTSARARLAHTILEPLHSDNPEAAETWATDIGRLVEADGRGELNKYAADDVFAEPRRVTIRTVSQTAG